MSTSMKEQNTCLPDPFSKEDYSELLERLEHDAKESAAHLGFDWPASMEQAPEKHTSARQALTILKLGLFDKDFYLTNYPDVASAGIEPLLHYVNFGDWEGRLPNPVFNPNAYRDQFGAAGLHSVCALYHYAVLGEALGLKASSAFEPHRYLMSNPTLQPWLDKPLTHFLHLGRPSGLSANLRYWLPPTVRIQVEKAASPAVPANVDLAQGINVIGPLDKVSGLGVSARGYFDGLRVAGMTALGCMTKQREFAIQKSVEGHSPLPKYLEDGAVNVVHMNGDTLPIMLKNDGDKLFRDKYNVAVWYWELPTLRPEWQASIKYFHEFWAPTPFIERALKQSTEKPVRLLPPYLAYLPTLQPQPSPENKRANFVYCFDANSILERKNPGALLDAFWMAFPLGSAQPDVQLTFKITYPNRKNQEVNRLYEAAEKDSRIQIIDHLLSDAELHALIASATAYVSPHRSEGLGLTVIEAMGAGVPVIATPFGGVDAFVTPDSAFPIRCRHVELEGDYIPYPHGFVWADPDVESLAQQLTFVLQNHSEAQRRAGVARQRVLDFFCSSGLIKTYKDELERISSLFKTTQ